MVEKSKLDVDTEGKAIDPSHYRGMIGTLLYLTAMIIDFWIEPVPSTCDLEQLEIINQAQSLYAIFIRVAEVLKHVLELSWCLYVSSVGYEHVAIYLVSQLESGTSTSVFKSNLKNKVEAHPRNVKTSLNKKNGVVNVKGSAVVQNLKKQDNSDSVCVNSNDCMSSNNSCVSNSMND
ncbi:hypothetical protein Tco_0035275, partial [Tanacetum coccineum]